MWAEFIAKYWLQFLFGLIVAGITAFHKKIKERYEHYRELHESERDKNLSSNMIAAMTPFLEEIAKKSDRDDAELRNELGALRHQMGTINEQIGNLSGQLDVVTQGVLNVQGSVFKRECRDLLKAGEISEDSYEICMHDHTVYNNLEGNHEGDQLFELVTARYKGQLQK